MCHGISSNDSKLFVRHEGTPRACLCGAQTSKTDRSSDSQDIPCFLSNPMVHYRVQKSPLLSQLNPIRFPPIFAHVPQILFSFQISKLTISTYLSSVPRVLHGPPILKKPPSRRHGALHAVASLPNYQEFNVYSSLAMC